MSETEKIQTSFLEKKEEITDVILDPHTQITTRIESADFYLPLGLKIKFFYGNELNHLSHHFLKSIASCYAQVFNESWGENWTEASALKLVQQSLMVASERTPVASFLIDSNDNVVGFAWGCLTNEQNLSTKLDMPFSLSSNKKAAALQLVRYWLSSVMKSKNIFVFRELGIIKAYRNNMSPFLCLPIFKAVLDQNCKLVFYWTNLKSKAFTWGISIGWIPFNFFVASDLIFMQGNLQHSYDLVSKMVYNSKSSQYKHMIKNLNYYFCR